MPKDKPSRTKRILTDIAGFTMILGGIAFGWLPGPGGIPLILGGLALLANNHHWAKQLLEYAQERGANLSRIIFPKNLLIQRLYDIGGMALVITAGYLALYHYNNFIGILITAMFFFGISILVLNRQRLTRFQTWRKNRKTKH